MMANPLVFGLTGGVEMARYVRFFSVLFSFCGNPSIFVADLAFNNWDLGFRCSLSPVELEDRHCLAAFFPTLSEISDTVTWLHSSSRKLSVKSLYLRLKVSGSPSSRFKDMWRARITLNIKIFLCQAIRGKLPVNDQIRKRNGRASSLCSLCSRDENTDHIPFNCDFASLIWSCTRSWLGVTWAPSSFVQLFPLVNSLSGQLKCIFWFGFAAVIWVLWTTRNKFTSEHVFPSKRADIIFKSLILLQQLYPLVKSCDLDAMELLISRVRSTATSLSPRVQAPTA